MKSDVCSGDSTRAALSSNCTNTCAPVVCSRSLLTPSLPVSVAKTTTVPPTAGRIGQYNLLCAKHWREAIDSERARAVQLRRASSAHSMAEGLSSQAADVRGGENGGGRARAPTEIIGLHTQSPSVVADNSVPRCVGNIEPHRRAHTTLCSRARLNARALSARRVK
jgi:hypothetical protein